MPQSPPITIQYAQDQLKQWLAALEACSTGANYSIAGRSLTRQDVPTIQGQITRWHRTLATLEQFGEGTIRPLGAVATFSTPGGAASNGIMPGDVWRSGRT